jgi:WD40 repeat protein
MNQPEPDAKTVLEVSAQHPQLTANTAPEIPDYELLKRIGEGSYGEVWLARSIMGTLRAVKIVHRHAFKSDRPFEREFEGIKRFEPVSQTNDSQLKIFHVGRREGYFYYIMELADDAAGARSDGVMESGSNVRTPIAACSTTPPLQDPCAYAPRTLRSELQRCGRLPMVETLEISLKLTQALAHLHGHELVHRDIKPSNIIFVNGQPKLADIGLVADTEGTLSFVGTEGYLPPEGPGKPPADIFSLGKVLYEISTGHDRNQFPELPTLWNSAAERESFAEFNEVIIKACAAQVEQRYETTEQMHADLLLLRAGKSLSRLRVLERRLTRLAKLSAAALALSAVVVAGYFYQQHQTRTSKRLAAQLQINNGLRLLDEGDFQGSLLWFVAALQTEQASLSADEQERHRVRIGAVLQQCPELAAVIVPDIGGGNQLLELLPRTLTQAIAPGAGDGKVADYGGKAEFGPDGRQILISGYGRSVLICDAATGKALQRLEHGTNVNGATFSGDGRRVVTWLEGRMAGMIGEVQLWDASSGQRIGQPLQHQDNHGITISRDGRRVLTLSRRDAQVWDADTSQKLSPALVHDAFIDGGKFSPDGHRVWTWTRPLQGSTNGLAQLWDATTGASVGSPMSGTWATFSRDDTRVLARDREKIVVRDGVSGQQLLAIPWPHSGRAGHLFTSDGKRLVLTGFYNGIIQTHDAATGAQIGPTIQQEDRCFAAVLSPDGTRIASSCGKHTHLWDLDTGRPVISPIPQNDHWLLQFSPDGRHLLTAGAEFDPVIRIWDLHNAEPALPPMSHQSWIFHAAFSPDGRRIVTASQDETARVWDAASAKPLGLPLHTNHTTDYSLFAAYGRLIHPVSGQRVISVPSGLAPTNVFHPVLGDKAFPARWGYLPGTNRAVFFSAFAPDSKRVLTASYDGTAGVWEAETGRELLPPLKHLGAIFHASFSRDGRRIVTASGDWTAQVWNAENGQRVGPLLKHQGAVLYAEFSPDGRAVVTASYDMTAQVWESETGVKIGPALKHPNTDNGPVFTAKFSPDGQRIVTASYDRTAQIWDARTGRKTTLPLRHRSFVYHAEFSPDGKQIVSSSSDQTAQAWNAVTGARTAPPLPHADVVNQAAFSRDSKRIVTASFDGTARVWDAATGQPLAPPLRHHDKVWHAEFSPDGQRILTASADGTARLWPLTQIDWPVSDLRLLAQSLAGQQIDHTGSLSSLAPEVLKENWQKLQSKYPDYARDSPPGERGE